MAEQEYEIRNKHMLIVAGALGLVAVLLVLWNESRIRRENDEDLIDILVAARDLKADQRLTDEDLGPERLPKRLVPQDILDDIARASDRDSLLNLETNQEVGKGKIMGYTYLRGSP
ncbi:MAG: SAF domain-containing protein, partial [Phycisphaerae bacterium]|nr:SAF domain-containing protein [Phycisphaerae bacterium]